MKKATWILLGAMLLALHGAGAEEAKPLFENNFEKAEVGKVPDGFMVLDGGYAVKEEAGNKFLELPGAPLDTFGVLFGSAEKENISVSASIDGTKKGRRYPTFGVGLNGQGGYKLQVSPGKGELELYKGDEVIAHVPYEWKSGEWTLLKLRVIKAGDAAWKVEGKAWTKGGTEPANWLINYDEKKEPTTGKASIWGQPYATTPIQFDDLVVTKASENK